MKQDIFWILTFTVLLIINVKHILFADSMFMATGDLIIIMAVCFSIATHVNNLIKKIKH